MEQQQQRAAAVCSCPSYSSENRTSFTHATLLSEQSGSGNRLSTNEHRPPASYSPHVKKIRRVERKLQVTTQMSKTNKETKNGEATARQRLSRVLGHMMPSNEIAPSYVNGCERKKHHAITSRQFLFQNEAFKELQLKTPLQIKEIKTLKVDNVSEYVSKLEWRENVCERSKLTGTPRGYNRFTSNDEYIIGDIIRKANHSGNCGSPCCGPVQDPTLLEKGRVETLHFNYGVNYIWGVKMGYAGIWKKEIPWLRLTPSSIIGINELGGTILGSSRGGFNLEAIVDSLGKNKISQLYIIGGDGSHRGAHAIYQEVKRRKLKITVAGIPKTIDNDVGIIDSSFGFNTAVEEATKAIRSSVTEACCIPNGIGITKLMGREAGFIAAHAVLASRQVDLCLIPEVPMPMEGEHGILDYIYNTCKVQGHAVIIVAEGAGLTLMKGDPNHRDESGNIRLPSVGTYLKQKINAYFESKGEKANIKYHDPSYMIRSVKANPPDPVMCNILAENPVPGAMAGFTGFTSGLVNHRSVLIPIPAIAVTSPIKLNPNGRFSSVSLYGHVCSANSGDMWCGFI
eukprot:jgi/Bigna1/77700/fgenesh1_pg.49_\